MKKLHRSADFFKCAFIFENNNIDGKITNGYCLLWSHELSELKHNVYYFTNTKQMLEFNNLLVDLLEKWTTNKDIYKWSWANQFALHSEIQKLYNSLGVF